MYFSIFTPIIVSFIIYVIRRAISYRASNRIAPLELWANAPPIFDPHGEYVEHSPSFVPVA
jgi:hypothetical protein